MLKEPRFLGRRTEIFLACVHRSPSPSSPSRMLFVLLFVASSPSDLTPTCLPVRFIRSCQNGPETNSVFKYIKEQAGVSDIDWNFSKVRIFAACSCPCSLNVARIWTDPVRQGGQVCSVLPGPHHQDRTFLLLIKPCEILSRSLIVCACAVCESG